jgi:hypothetical protein
MPRYEVQVQFTEQKTKPIRVWARDEHEAEEKAVSIVEDWENVIEAEAMDIEESE